MNRFFILFLLLVASRVGATDILIRVKDKQTDDRLAGASLTITDKTGKSWQNKTKGNGEFSLQGISFPITIHCQYIGYLPYTDTLLQGPSVTIQPIDIRLQANPAQMHDLVVTGQVSPVLAKQSIYKVQTIGSQEMNRRGAVSMNELLNFEMNNYISTDNVLGSNVNIGGIGGQNVKILVNGIPVMGRENGNIDMGQLNLNNVKRVEMIQGPMSVMYGSNALGGVINLITQTNQKKYSASARTYYESIGRYNVSAQAGFNRKKHQVQLSFARNFFAGWTPSDSVDRYQLWKPKTQYLGDLQYETRIGKTKLNYYGSFLHEKITNKGEPIINPYEGYAFDEYYRTQRIIHAIGLHRYVRKNTDQVSITNSIQTYHRTKNRLKKDLVTLQEIETRNIGDQDTTQFVNFNSRGVYSTNRFKRLDMLAGYEYAYEYGQSYKLANQHQQMSETGVFISGVYKMKKWQLQPSGRLTYNDRYHSAFTPAIHFKYDPNAHTQFRASYAKGFRTPTLKELYLQFIDQNHTIIGNLNLQPEIGKHYEMSIDQSKVAGKTTLGYSVVASHNAIKNLIALAVFNNHGVLRQYDNIEFYKNWVFAVKGRMSREKIDIQSGVGITMVEKSSVTPQHFLFEASSNLSYQISRIRTRLNINYKYNSRQPVITIDQQFLYSSPLHIANVSLQRSFLHEKLMGQIGVKNVLNIQGVTLSGNLNTQNNAHANSGNMQAFPARSIFLDFSYSL
ncbi:MAG: hypothetical protein RIQ62_532 [Bacteroidota bacterium]